jgi:hypothetical protein
MRVIHSRTYVVLNKLVRITLGAVEIPRMSSHLGMVAWYLNPAAKNTKPVDNRIYNAVDQKEWISNMLIGKTALMIMHIAPKIPHAWARYSMLI